MLAIDIPISLLAGLVVAESGKNMLKGNDPDQHYFMKSTVLLFAAFFITPVPFYFFLGWPAWEVNFLWRWQDNIHDSPLKAAVSFAVFLLTVGPTYIGFLVGKYWLRKGNDIYVRIGYILMAVLVGIIVFVTRGITFNIASTYEKFQAKEFYSFWSHPFFTGWLLVTIYFWGSLFACYLWVSKRDKQYNNEIN